MSCPLSHDGLSSWLKCWVDRFGPFPDDYLVVDTETTGLDRQDDLIVQLGYCRVRDGKISDNVAVVLDWTAHSLDQDWLRARIQSTRARMESKGRTYQWTPERLAAEGVSPTATIFDLLKRLAEAIRAGATVVAHNGVGFDIPMIESHVKRFLSLNFAFPRNIWDTGAMEKANQLDMRPSRDDTPYNFARRALGVRSPVKWSLDRHAVPRYGLDRKHGLDLARCHTADYDAYVTSLLFEEYRHIWSTGRGVPDSRGEPVCVSSVSTSA